MYCKLLKANNFLLYFRAQILRFKEILILTIINKINLRKNSLEKFTKIRGNDRVKIDSHGEIFRYTVYRNAVM